MRSFLKKRMNSKSFGGLSILLGKKPRKIINSTQIKELARTAAKIPEWLFEESYTTVGDLGETISLLLGSRVTSRSSFVFPQDDKKSSLKSWIDSINSLNIKNFDEVLSFILKTWSQLSKDEIFVFNKILMGSLSIGVSKQLVIKGLSKATEIPTQILQHKLSGDFNPNEITFEELINSEGSEEKRPYPFFLATQIDFPVEELGDPNEWFAEWKWDGIRAQIMKRNGEIIIWSRGEDLITNSFPELVDEAQKLPDNTVLDGELLIYKDKVRPFNDLQQRLNRKNVTEKLIQEFPGAFYCYDILELSSKDLRNEELKVRRSEHEKLFGYINFTNFKISQQIEFQTW
jgi:DNA ligase-1